ncbi:MAG: GNAT family N-acetyltransferase [Bacteroidales bacterium]|jgi:predicted acetyltransferase|nr:GNAT family N-acetyltransferase [Bacteroidales bacterium]
MITFADKAHKEDIIRIWQTSFPDDPPQFISMYFDKIYRDENTLIYLCDNKVVSCMQMLPYELNYCDAVCPTAYISGAATLPQYRQQGIMGKLLTRSFLEMRKRGIVFTILIPQESSLTTYYQKQGYTPCFEYASVSVFLEDTPFSEDFSVVEMNDANKDDAYCFFERHSRRKNLTVLKNRDDFQVIWEDVRLGSGSILLCYRRGETVGICFCYPPLRGRLVIKEMLSESAVVRNQLLYAAFRRFNTSEIDLRQAVTNPDNAVFHGMARIIHTEKALQLYASCYDQLQITIQVSDNQIEDNNGIFRLDRGNCIRLPNGSCDFNVDVNLLTQLLFGYQTEKLPQKYHLFPQQHPYMSLMLD